MPPKKKKQQRQPKTPRSPVASQRSATELTQRLAPQQHWFPPEALARFLADAEFGLWRMCCRLLPHLTLSTSNSAAFLCPLERSSAATTAPASDEMMPDMSTPFLKVHDEAYRAIRSTIAASCALGNRSCQAIWGPRGCGKHRIMRLIARDCERMPNAFVIQLDGGLLRGDEAAIRVIARQMLAFLQSPQSLALREADWSMRTGTFDFGRLFHFDQEMEKAAAPRAVRAGGGPSIQPPRSRARGRQAGADHRKRRRSASLASTSSSDDGSVAGEEKTFITATTSHLPGGAASSLSPLQQALLRMTHCHVSLIVCIRRADLFALWCDQLLYVLSGLMHDSDGHGGGMSLVLSSAAADLRQVEKRLSSRLTGMTRFIPLLPWTPQGILRTMLSIVADYCSVQLEELDLQDMKKEVTATASLPPSTPRSKAVEKAETLLADFERRQAALNTRRHALTPLLPPELCRVRPRSPPPTPTTIPAQDTTQPISLHAHPSLLLDAWRHLAETIISSVDADCTGCKNGADTHEDSRTITGTTIVTYLRGITHDMEKTAASPGVVVTAVASALARASSGILPALETSAQSSVLQWLQGRVAQEAAWSWRGPEEAVVACPAALRKDTPLPLVQRWCSEKVSLGHSPKVQRTSLGAPLPPDLFDLLGDSKLVPLGYTARESFVTLFHVLLHHDAGRRSRAVSDLLEDISSSLGTKAAAALDTDAYRAAIHQLCRWRVLSLQEDTQVVWLCGSASRLREFIGAVLEQREAWCEELLGLDAKDYMRIRSLI